MGLFGDLKIFGTNAKVTIDPTKSADFVGPAPIDMASLATLQEKLGDTEFKKYVLNNWEDSKPVTPVTTEKADGTIVTEYQQNTTAPTTTGVPLQTGVQATTTPESYTSTPDVVISSIDNPAKITVTELPPNEYSTQAAKDAFAINQVDQSIDNDVFNAASKEKYGATDAFAIDQVEQSINNDVFNAADTSPYGKADAIKSLEAEMGLPSNESFQSPFAQKSNTIADVEKERETLRKNNYSFSIKQDTKVRLFAPRGKENSIYGYPDKFNNILTILHATQGIVFPYTPTITESQTAEYAQSQLVSSNQDYYAYKTTGSTKINITGELVVETQYDAEYMLAVRHFMTVLSKSHFGKKDTAKAGLPPPIMNLSGYGKYMYDHLPVILAGYNFTFDNDLDMIDVVDGQGYVTKVPKKLTLVLDLTVQNTPRRLREEFNLDEFRTGELMRKSKGWI